MKADKAIVSLLLPTGEPDSIGPDYIEKLLRGFEERRAHHAGDLARWASEDDWDTDPKVVALMREKYLSRFLEYTAHDMRGVLLDLMAAEESRAAALFLHGHQRGFWTATAGELAEACTLCPSPAPAPAPAPVKLPTPAPKTNVMQPLKWADLESGGMRREPGTATRLSTVEVETKLAELEPLLSAVRAAEAMREVLESPNSTGFQRITAIHAYFEALETSNAAMAEPQPSTTGHNKRSK